MISCYLDSQDYSTLTDPNLDAPHLREIRDALLHLARSRQVRFAFSAAAVCELVAMRPDAAHLAELKAELLTDLCGSNALVSFDRLATEEANALARRSGPPSDMLDQSGRWFPEIPIEAPNRPWERMREVAEEEMKALGLSRQQRRAKTRSLIKNGKPRTALREHLAQQDPHAFAAEILMTYPMHPDYAEMMANYCLGRATEMDFSEALTNSLIDPRWMMKWFTTQHALSSPIADIVRQPGRELGGQMRSLAETVARWAAALIDSGLDVDPTGKAGEITARWQEMEERTLVAMAQRFSSANGIEQGVYDATDVRTFCPGLAACVGSLYSSVWANIGEGRREEPSNSQPVDAMHALYAPYVDVFRAD
jgi:hypothetical protein